MRVAIGSLEELALDIDDLNLDDIEFDSFDDDPDSAGVYDGDNPKGRPTQLDDDGDFDDLLKQVEDLAGRSGLYDDRKSRSKRDRRAGLKRGLP